MKQQTPQIKPDSPEEEPEPGEHHECQKQPAAAPNKTRVLHLPWTRRDILPQRQTGTGRAAETKEQRLPCVNSIKIIKAFWRPETWGSTASARTCKKLAEFAAADYCRNGNL